MFSFAHSLVVYLSKLINPIKKNLTYWLVFCKTIKKLTETYFFELKQSYFVNELIVQKYLKKKVVKN